MIFLNFAPEIVRNGVYIYSPEFKTQVALEAIRESMPLAEIAKKYEITPSMVSELKEEFLAGASQIFL